MKLIDKDGRIEIWQVGNEYYVYGIHKDPRVVPSLSMAYAIAAKEA